MLRAQKTSGIKRLLAVLGITASLAPLAMAQTQKIPHGEIVWDTYGTPHIFAKNTIGLFYGFGYAQAKAHADLLLLLYAESRGRAAEYFGPKYAASDRYLAANGVYPRAIDWYKQQTPAMKANLEAFAAGVNDYAKQHPDALSPEVRAVLPVSGVDVVAHWERVMQFQYIAPMQKVFGAAQAAAMLHDPLPPANEPHDDAGSNGWAIAPSKSVSGNAMLLMNPHLAWAPSFMTYFEAQLVAPGISLYGATQVGFPVLRFCFSDSHGLTNTVNTISGETVYKITPSGDGYAFDGATKPFEKTTHTIKIKEPDGTLKSETFEVLHTVHGPVFTRTDGTKVALRVSGLDRPFGIQEYWDLDLANDFATFQTVLKRLQVPMFNMLYADRDGHIQYFFNAIVPIRDHGDYKFWEGLVPGDTSANLWTKIHPYEDLPNIIDPPAGWLQNTNNPPWISTALPPLSPDKFPPYMSTNNMTLRAEQSEILLGTSPKLTFDSFVQLKLTTQSLMAKRLLPELLSAAEGSQSPLVQQAVAVLKAWDYNDNNDSKGALLFETWAGKFAGPQFLTQTNYAKPWSFSDPLNTPSGLKDPQAAVAMLEDAARQTIALYGKLDRPFGEVSRFHLGTYNLPGNGGFGNTGIFRVVTWSPLKNGERIPLHGETFIAMIEFGKKTTHAEGLLTYGDASQPGSKHIGDQLQLLSDKKLRPIWRDRAELKDHTEDTFSF
jgi:acyl-homoserine-lactone acylase